MERTGETIGEHFRLINAGDESPHAAAFDASLSRIHESLSAAFNRNPPASDPIDS